MTMGLKGKNSGRNTMNPRIKSTPNWRIKITLLLFTAIVVYAIWNAKNLILGPRIDVLEPIDGSLLSSNTVLIKGVVKNGSFISLNGRQIFTDDMGIFLEEILPLKGYNVVEISAQDRFDKKRSKIIRFYYNK